MSKSNLNPMAGYDYTNNSRYNFKGKSDSGQSSGGNTMGGGLVETTYDKLVKLRDGGKLVPGCYYRITDYETIIDPTLDVGLNDTAKNDEVKDISIPNFDVAGHKFDIVVMALTNDTLSENASAMRSKDDGVTSIRLYSNKTEENYVININSSCYSRTVLDNCSDKTMKLYQKDLIELEIDGVQVTGYTFYQNDLIVVGTGLTIFIPIDTLDNLIQLGDYYYTENVLYTLDGNNNILGTMTMYINDDKIYYDRVNSGIDSPLSVFCRGNECIGISSLTGGITKEIKQINDTYTIIKGEGVDVDFVILNPQIDTTVLYEYFNIQDIENYFELPDGAVIMGIVFTVQNDKLNNSLKFGDLQITCIYMIGGDYEKIHFASIPVTQLGNPNNIQLETHTYFENSALQSWKLKYCLDNNKCRFDWVSDKEQEIHEHKYGDFHIQTLSGKIQHIIDYYVPYVGRMTFSEACEYLNKEIALPSGKTETDLIDLYFEDNDNELSRLPTIIDFSLHTDTSSVKYVKQQGLNYVLANIGDYYILEEVNFTEYGESIDIDITLHMSKGVIYYMEDEFGNRAGFDFKNIGAKFNDVQTTSFTYAFSRIPGLMENPEITDNSLNNNVEYNCTDNEILVQGASLLNRFANIAITYGTYNFTNNTIIPYTEEPIPTFDYEPVSSCVNNGDAFVSKYGFSVTVEKDLCSTYGVCPKETLINGGKKTNDGTVDGVIKQ